MSGFTLLSVEDETRLRSCLRDHIVYCKHGIEICDSVGAQEKAEDWKAEISKVENLIQKIEKHGLWFGEQRGVIIL